MRECSRPRKENPEPDLPQLVWNLQRQQWTRSDRPKVRNVTTLSSARWTRMMHSLEGTTSFSRSIVRSLLPVHPRISGGRSWFLSISIPKFLVTVGLVELAADTIFASDSLNVSGVHLFCKIARALHVLFSRVRARNQIQHLPPPWLLAFRECTFHRPVMHIAKPGLQGFRDVYVNVSHTGNQGHACSQRECGWACARLLSEKMCY